MVEIVIRAIQGVVAVLVGVGTAAYIGDGTRGKLAAIAIGAVCAVLIEYVLRIAPHKSQRARTLLDRRSVFEGVWIQDVKKVVTDGKESESNRFAVYTVRFADDFTIEGRSYDEHGKEFSRWRSDGPVNFSRDCRTMTYLWTGDVLGTTLTADRKGFAQVQLSSSGDGGTGRVDHVSMHVTLLFDLRRVTPALLAGSPSSLAHAQCPRQLTTRE